MEDYIFLIIAVALSIFGAINQSKKKKEANVPLSEKTAKPRSFFLDQLLGEDFLPEPKQEVKPLSIVKPVLKKELLVNPMSADQSGIYHTSFVSTLPDRSEKPLQPSLRKPLIEPAGDEDEADEIPGYLEDFSLRRAFVYSEIMHRKY